MDLQSLIIKNLHRVVERTDIDVSNLTPIQEFYKDTKVFVTGATGFLGQVLIEKLLRSCPVSTIYLLVRSKKGKSADIRLKEIVDDPLFGPLKKIFPNFLKKLVIIEGDCALPGLGLSDHDKELLINEVNIVFHVAATVRFDAKLETSVAINVRATRDLSQIAQQMPNFKSFVQVSTAFANCLNATIEEKVYTPPINYSNLIEMTETLDPILLDNITPHLVGQYPNTYVYTKQIGEEIIKHETHGLAAGIYRPSIVVSTYKEPVRGWINNIYGAAGVTFGAALGVLKVFYCADDTHANLVPVDMCVNGLIAVAWDVAEKFKKAKIKNEEFQVPVYNYESTNDKPIVWKDYKDVTAKYGKLMPSARCVWVYSLLLIKSYWMYWILTYALHMIPGLIIDTVLYVKGKKTRMLKVYKKIHDAASLISYFSIRSFHFKSANVQKMVAGMTKKDKDIFFCDLKQLDWEEYFTTYLPGGRIYFFKDPLETVPEGEKHMKKLIWIQRVVLALVGLLALATSWTVISIFYRYIFT